MIPWRLAFPDRKAWRQRNDLEEFKRPLVYGDAGDIRAAAIAQIETLAQLCELPEYGVHSVFAGIYLHTSRNLLASLDRLAAPAFGYMIMIRFHALYEHHVTRRVLTSLPIVAPHWRRYGMLAARSDLSSRVDRLFQLMALGARAHIRFDLIDAIRLAANDYRCFQGRNPDFRSEHEALLGAATNDAFFDAAIAFNAVYRGREHGWRHTQLVGHAAMARLFRPVWVFILQLWRRRAWRDAMAANRQGTGAA